MGLATEREHRKIKEIHEWNILTSRVIGDLSGKPRAEIVRVNAPTRNWKCYYSNKGDSAKGTNDI